MCCRRLSAIRRRTTLVQPAAILPHHASSGKQFFAFHRRESPVRSRTGLPGSTPPPETSPVADEPNRHKAIREGGFFVATIAPIRHPTTRLESPRNARRCCGTPGHLSTCAAFWSRSWTSRGATTGRRTVGHVWDGCGRVQIGTRFQFTGHGERNWTPAWHHC